MASSKLFFPLSFMLIIQSILSSRSISALLLDPNKSSPVEFLRHLQGCHKGDKVEGVRELKHYLEHYGYLNYNQSAHPTIHANDDDFDDLLENAVKTYQLNYHLNPTGSLDSKTVNMMTKSRCGVADFINGTTRMRSGKRETRHSSNLHTVAHYAFFRGNPRWPSSKYHLTYGFLPQTRSDAINPVSRAFATWGRSDGFHLHSG